MGKDERKLVSLESLGHEIMEEKADPKERTESAESSADCEGTGNGQ